MDRALLRRDGWRCVRCGARTRLTVHHIRKRSQGGSSSRDNLVVLCVACNLWVEDNPREAWETGLVARAGDTLGECWERMVAAGLVSRSPTSPGASQRRRRRSSRGSTPSTSS